MPFPKIEPCIQSAEENRKHKNHEAGNFDINDLLYIMDDKRAYVGKRRKMLRSQPDLEMGKRTLAVENLNDESKSKACEMKDLDPLVLNSPEGAKEKKQNPEEMDEDNDISKDLVKHCYVLRESWVGATSVALISGG